MKRRWTIVGIAVLAIALTVSVWVTFRCSAKEEPTYNSRKLSDWIKDAPSLNGFNASEAQKKAALMAMQSMGTNAMPWLVEWIVYEPPRLPFALERKIPIVRDRLKQRYTLQVGACQMLYLLGKNGAAGIPFIIHRMETLPPSNAAHRFGCALLDIGPPGEIALADSVTNAKIALSNRLYLIGMLRLRYWDLKEPQRTYVQAALTNCLNDPLPQIREAVQRPFQID